MFNLCEKAGLLTIAALFFVLSAGARADIVFPALAIDTAFGGTGVQNSGGTLTIDATAFSIHLDSIPVSSIDIADVSFSLTATYSGSANNLHTFTGGTLSAGPYMEATIDSLLLVNAGSGTGILQADIFYTGGSLVTAGTTGRIEGGIQGSSTDDFSLDFTAGTFQAKAGPVVPVPAAVWLFGSGLLGLVAVARRKKAAA